MPTSYAQFEAHPLASIAALVLKSLVCVTLVLYPYPASHAAPALDAQNARARSKPIAHLSLIAVSGVIVAKADLQQPEPINKVQIGRLCEATQDASSWRLPSQSTRNGALTVRTTTPSFAAVDTVRRPEHRRVNQTPCLTQECLKKARFDR